MPDFMRSLSSLGTRMKNKLEKEQESITSSIFSPRNSSRDDQPPAYTVAVNDCNSPYTFLALFDILLLIDDSGSMAGRRWSDTENAIAAIAPICADYDADGFDVCFLHHRNIQNMETGAFTKIATAMGVHELFQTVIPGDVTPVGRRLYDILDPYMRRVESMSKARLNGNAAVPTVKPLNIIVITDGSPTDDVESVVINVAKRLDKCNAQPWQVGIQFVQVGNDAKATQWLQELDDVLHKEQGVRDIVDTAPWSGNQFSVETLMKIMLGGIDKRFDRKNISNAAVK
ncbi:hypothetical protein AJ79_02077 [Helicocarpus griseus UAMH5409]|uniref:VWFA domain-containing protein n=1 Tax=Helicocarpus griseus UAMH5409 TaxID=1447875 RepID=A0A2B7Y3U1_9EURO|nr:hypothetical protein AJ79_02077 [Helicocarpus griseus UAMH5409]